MSEVESEVESEAAGACVCWSLPGSSVTEYLSAGKFYLLHLRYPLMESGNIVLAGPLVCLDNFRLFGCRFVCTKVDSFLLLFCPTLLRSLLTALSLLSLPFCGTL